MSRSIFIFNNRNNPTEGRREVTEAELQIYKNSCDGKPYIINLGYALMEVTEPDYKDFYKVRRREKYIQEEAIRAGEFSYNAFDCDEYDGASFIADSSEPFEEKVMRNMMIEKLPEAIAMLTEDEKELICKIYFEHISDTKLAQEYGVNQSTITRRKTKILKKLNNYFENTL